MWRSRYSTTELKDIRERNANRLPPAKAVHGMALYELERASEQEQLFHLAVFDLDRIRRTTTSQQSRTDSLDRLVQACASHHDSERSVSLTAVHTIQDALTSFTPNDADSKAVIKRSNWLMNEPDQEGISTEDQVALTTVLTIHLTHEAKMELQQAVKHLKGDHLTVTNDLLEAKSRISKLEDLVRALTAQRGRLEPSKMTQQLDATTSQYDDKDTLAESDDSLASAQAIDSRRRGPLIKTEDVEKPLPPIPAATAFSTLPSRNAPSEAAEEAKRSTSSKPSPVCDDTIHRDVSLIVDALLSPVSPIETPNLDAKDLPPSGSGPKSKGKAKKWTDPPIFPGDHATVSAGHKETLVSLSGTSKDAPSVVHQTQAQASSPSIAAPSVARPKTGSSYLEMLRANMRNNENRPPQVAHPFMSFDEPQPEQVTPPKFTADAMKSTIQSVALKSESVASAASDIQSVAPKDNYVTSADSNYAPTEASATLRVPVASKTATPGVSYKITSPALVSKDINSQLTGSRKIARGTAVKIVQTGDLGPVTTAPVSVESQNITFPSLQSIAASQTPSLQEKKAKAEDGEEGGEQTHAKKTTAPASSFNVTSQPASRPIMSPGAPAFQPSTPFAASLDTSTSAAFEGNPTLSRLMAQMTPEASARFLQNVSKV